MTERVRAGVVEQEDSGVDGTGCERGQLLRESGKVILILIPILKVTVNGNLTTKINGTVSGRLITKVNGRMQMKGSAMIVGRT